MLDNFTFAAFALFFLNDTFVCQNYLHNYCVKFDTFVVPEHTHHMCENSTHDV